MKNFLKGFFGAVMGAGVVVTLLFFISAGSDDTLQERRTWGAVLEAISGAAPSTPEKSPEERRAEALERSSKIRGLYMTADVANDQGRGAARIREHIIELAKTTEINGIVVDVKEVCGPDYNLLYLKQLLDTLHHDNIWAIGRIVVFKDASQIYVHPEWYLKRASPKHVTDWCANRKYLRAPSPSGIIPNTANLWQDDKGGYWLDPASPGARNYILAFAKKIIDLGFDELQFDYIRFPSDGDVNAAIYPAWNKKTPKYEVMKSFFSFLETGLRKYKPDIIISADLFGYAALQHGDVGIGQRLEDIGEKFDYISFMVYPSHYYSGLYLSADSERGLPVVALDKKGVRLHPDITVGRSLRTARDFLDGIITGNGSTTFLASTTNSGVLSPTRLRPWLEDFFHEADRLGGRPYGSQKVRMQINAAEQVEQHGWLLWNAANVYTVGALRPEQ